MNGIVSWSSKEAKAAEIQQKLGEGGRGASERCLSVGDTVVCKKQVEVTRSFGFLTSPVARSYNMEMSR